MTARSETAARIHELSTRLSAGATATETLLAWCEEHGLSDGPITVECQQRQVLAAVPDATLKILRLTSGNSVCFRRVRIKRGDLALAAAETWFVPECLAISMTEALHTTNVPFGTVVAPLRPSRRTLAARVQPLTADPAQHPLQPGSSIDQGPASLSSSIKP